MANPNGKKQKRAVARKIWFVKHPITQYKEDVKALAAQHQLRILDAQFRGDYEGDIVAKEVPELTIDPDYVKYSRGGKPTVTQAAMSTTVVSDEVLAKANATATETIASADAEAEAIKQKAQEEADAIVKAAQLQAKAVTDKVKK